MKGRVFPGFCVVLVLLLLFGLMCPSVLAEGSAPQEKYIARTVDGVDLAVRRYHPDADSPMRNGGQPVILMAGFACNSDFFDIHTPEGVTYDETLPAELADWAVGDVRLQEDPMKYYNMAYYLWSQGYDPWIANYRCQGRDPYRSGGTGTNAIDEYGIYDMPAIITLVREVTGRKPVWAGHSMGAVMASIYLEGCRFEDMANPDSRVISDPALKAERNNGEGVQALKGFISLDGPSWPCGNVSWLMGALLWTIFYIPYYLDLRPLTSSLGGAVAEPVGALDRLFWSIWGQLGFPDYTFPFQAMLSLNPDNLDGNLTAYVFQYAADGFSSRAMLQFVDACYNHKMREDYRNGTFNWWRWCPPTPYEGDGYYYYSDNFDKISLPSLFIVDDTSDITIPENVIEVYNEKTRDPLDRCFRIPGTAHLDVVAGLNAPTELYPRVGAFLESLTP